MEKLENTKELIRCWVESWGLDQVYVAYSGGKDSEVLLDIVRRMYPRVLAVFSNTGLEFPEIVKHVRTHANVIELRPNIPFHKVIEKYGWPVVSKNVSMAISRYRNTVRQDQKDYRLNGKIVDGKKLTVGTIPKKWQYLINAPFKISEGCCTHLKKNPFKKFEKLSGLRPMIGVMSADSHLRKRDIISRGCNVYDAKSPQSRPLAAWTEEDVYEYINQANVKICSIYSKGYDRTGCIFCMFGLEQEQKSTGENRFKKLKSTHPKLYNYCIKKLGADEILDFMGVDYGQPKGGNVVGNNRRPPEEYFTGGNTMGDGFEMPSDTDKLYEQAGTGEPELLDETVTVDDLEQALEVQRTDMTSVTDVYNSIPFHTEAEAPTQAPTGPERKPCPECGKNVTWTQAGKPRSHKCEPKDNTKECADEQGNATETPTPSTGVNADMVIQRFIETRDVIAQKTKALKAEVTDLVTLQERRAAWLKGEMDRLKVTNVGGPHGTCFIDMKTSATVTDIEAFLEWVHKDWENRKAFLTKAINKTEVNQLLDDGESLPPGINYTAFKDVKVQRR